MHNSLYYFDSVIHVGSFVILVFYQIIPPKEFVPRRHGYDDVDLIIPAPVKQMLNGSKGVYQLFNIQQKPITVKEFQVIANEDV